MSGEYTSQDPTADEMLESMVADSIGPDNPMTPEALDAATVEVGGRLDAARDVLTDRTKQITGIDTQALFALLLLDRERGAFDQDRS